MNWIDNNINIISFAGTVVGIIGLIITFLTFLLTGNIKKALNSEKFKDSFKTKYSMIVKNIDVYKHQINDNDINEKVLQDILVIVNALINYSSENKELWKLKDRIYLIYIKYYLKQCLNKKVKNFKDKIAYYLTEIKSMLEKEGKYYDIRPDRRQIDEDNECYKTKANKVEIH